MKRKLKLLATLSIAAGMSIMSASPSFAQGGMKGMDMKAIRSENKTPERVHRAAGTVTSVTRGLAAVRIAHGPVPSLNWPAMTMTYAVNEKALLDKMEQGDNVVFTFVKSGEEYVITAIE